MNITCWARGHRPVRSITGVRLDSMSIDGAIGGTITDSRYDCGRCGAREISARKPYERSLRVLRVLSWPSKFPPWSWVDAFTSWASVTRARLAVWVAFCAVIVGIAIYVHVR